MVNDMIDTGWIKLRRKTLEWEWYDHIPTKVLFIHLLLKANYKQSKYQGINIPDGSVVTGRKALSSETGLTEQQVRTALRNLKSTSTITIKKYAKFSVISIVKWDFYQTDNQQNNQLSTSHQPAINQLSTTSKESKKERKEYITANAECDLLGDDLEDSKKAKEKRDEEIFNEWYQHYPRKVSKGQARKAFKRVVDKVGLDRLIEATKNYAASVQGKDKAYIKHPASWLNGECWDDDEQDMPTNGPTGIDRMVIRGVEHFRCGHEWLPLRK